LFQRRVLDPIQIDDDSFEDKQESFIFTLIAVLLARSIAPIPISRMCSSTICFNFVVAFGTRLTNLYKSAKSNEEIWEIVVLFFFSWNEFSNLNVFHRV